MDRLSSFMEMCCYLFPYIDSTYDSLRIHSCLLFGFDMDDLKKEVKKSLDNMLDEMRSLSNSRNVSFEGDYRKESFIFIDSSLDYNYDLDYVFGDFEKVMKVCSRLIDGFGYSMNFNIENGRVYAIIDIRTYTSYNHL